MSQDRLLRPTEVDRMLQQVTADQNAKQQAERALNQKLKDTLNNPERITELRQSLVGIGMDGEHVKVMVATPSGERIDVMIPRRGALQIGSALLNIKQDEKKAA